MFLLIITSTFYITAMASSHVNNDISPPKWAENAVWYQIMPERFANGNTTNNTTAAHLEHSNIPNWKLREWTSDWYQLDPWEVTSGGFSHSVWHRRYGGDIEGIRRSLPYLQKLGVNALYLTPVFHARSLHKYDATSHHHIDPFFGPDPQGDLKRITNAKETDDPATWIWTEADKDFLRLVKEIHARNMYIIIDGVFNHTGRDFFAYRDIVRNGKDSPYTSWYDIKDWGKKYHDGFKVTGWAGHQGLPQLARDTNSLALPVREYIFAVTRRWMQPKGSGITEKGVDGWRLDVAYCLPHGFWKDWCAHVRSINSNAYTTGELVEIAPDYTGDEFDALMNYPFTYCLAEFFIDRTSRVTATTFDKHLKEIRDAYPHDTTLVMQNLIGSHDANRVASAIVNADRYYRDWGAYHNSSQVLHNRHYDVRKPNTKERAIQKLIVLFQMTYIGAPMIYYGDEAGMWGANDPCNRKPMLWPDKKYAPEKAHPYNKERTEDAVVFDRELFEFYSQLIHVRRSSPALSHGTYSTLLADDEKNTFMFIREADDEKVIVVINNSEEEKEIPWPEEYAKEKWKGVLTRQTVSKKGCTLPPVSGDIYFLAK